MPVLAQSSAYEPLVIEDARWRIVYNGGYYTEDSSCCAVTEYWMHGDTIFDSVRMIRYAPENVDSVAYNVKYKVVWGRAMRTISNSTYEYVPLVSPNKNVYIREDTSEQMVYCYGCKHNQNLQAEERLYDFSLEVGDHIPPYHISLHPSGFEVFDVQAGFWYDRYRRIFGIRHGSFLYEGLGSERGLFEHIYDVTYSPSPRLRDYCIGNDSTCGIFPYILSLTDKAPIATWDIYPNPAKDQVSIHLRAQGRLQDFHLVLRDALGRSMYTQVIPEPDVDLNVSDLPPGIYVCELLYQNRLLQRKRLLIR